jgi:hypothetical protein
MAETFLSFIYNSLKVEYQELFTLKLRSKAGILQEKEILAVRLFLSFFHSFFPFFLSFSSRSVILLCYM